jgi:hypothetical protein
MNTSISRMISDSDRRLLADAIALLEQPSLAARLSNYVGQPIEMLIDRLPAGSSDVIARATDQALRAALKVALTTLKPGERLRSNRLHQLTATASGVAGGAFGLPALTVELPLSTTIMLRSIADIARSEGEDLKTPAAQLACIETFALGGPRSDDDATESGYFAIRAVLAKAVSEATTYLATHRVAAEGAPILVKLIAQVAARFSIPVTSKVAAQTVPVIGGVGGGVVNGLFIAHYQDMAAGHFLVRRLERQYGSDVVRTAYEQIAPN